MELRRGHLAVALVAAVVATGLLMADVTDVERRLTRLETAFAADHDPQGQHVQLTPAVRQGRA